jgi:uncharacterized protein YuzE
MKIHYDPEVDALYIELTKGNYEVSREISDSIVVDEDKNGKVLGIEILDASKTLSKQEIDSMVTKKKIDYPARAVAHKISR